MQLIEYMRSKRLHVIVSILNQRSSNSCFFRFKNPRANRCSKILLSGRELNIGVTFLCENLCENQNVVTMRLEFYR